jgi:hypothetical protein
MKFEVGKSGNKRGRPPGSKNKLPNRDGLISLLEMITLDLTNNYSDLSTNQKIRILASFHDLYRDSVVLSLQTALDEALTIDTIHFEFDE